MSFYGIHLCSHLSDHSLLPGLRPTASAAVFVAHPAFLFFSAEPRHLGVPHPLHRQIFY
jgi:hypothetical protein